MKTLSVIIGVIVLASIIQFIRYYSSVKNIKIGECIVLPVSYFPFQGEYCVR